MINKKQSTVEAIYPLSYMQQGLLIHHLSSELDQGFLNTECTLTGDFDLVLFQESCAFIVNRHDVLRSTIHWRNLEKPLHVFHKSKEIEIEYLDWIEASSTEKKTSWDKLKEDAFKNGAKLETGALLRITIAKISNSQFKMLWPMHHILLDGWSGSIIIKDLFSVYNSLYFKKTPQLDTLPNYKAYLKWTNELPEEDAKVFWKDYLKDYKTPLLFSSNIITTDKVETTISNTFNLFEKETNQIKDYCKENKITVNTLIQCIWSLVLAKFFNTKDVVHGTTVSGRAGDFPNIDLLAGMFMNVQPVRSKIDENMTFSNWFQNMQKLHFEARKFEYLSLETLYEYINWSENSTLFDSLVVFENYPALKAENNILEVSDIKSGLTSTYPVTLAVLPGIETKFVLTTSSKYVDSDMALWLINSLKKVLELITSKEITKYSVLNESIDDFKKSGSEQIDKNNSVISDTYIAPKNNTELQLLQIWESLLGINQISTKANFFELGGKSLVAVKMFTLINRKFKTKLSATALLEHPTIEKLSNYISSDSKTESWKYVIPIKSKGDKNPLFCVHGGGGYVIFFNPLSNALNTDIPVYALQPAGLNNDSTMHDSIENMALDYAKEIKEVQSKGPYNILTYCFSPAVGIEIANIFKKEGEKTNLIVIDSIIKQEDFTDPERIKMRIYGFLNRVLKNPINAVKLMTINNYRRFLEPMVIKLFASNSKKNLDKITRNLVKIYVNYGWNKNHTDDVLLILTEKADKKLNPTYIKSWEGITNGNVEVRYTTGKHHELFDSPHIESIANHIENSIYKT